MVTLIGTDSFDGGTVAPLDLPATTRTGDLIVAVSANAAGDSSNFNIAEDPRWLHNLSQFDFPAFRIRVGYATADGNVPVPLTDPGLVRNGSALVAVYRGLTLPEPAPSTTQATGASITGTIADGLDARSTLACVVAVSSNIGLPDSEYIRDAVVQHGAASSISLAICRWEGDTPPVASFSLTPSASWRTKTIALLRQLGVVTVRKYPVDKGRGWPPPRDRSRGRRVGGYQ